MRRLLFAVLAATISACSDAASNDTVDDAGAAPHDAAVPVADGNAADATGAHDAGADVSADASPPDAQPDASAPDAATAYDDAILADQPVAYWRVDRTTGTEPDLTGHGNDGTYKGNK